MELVAWLVVTSAVGPLAFVTIHVNNFKLRRAEIISGLYS